jgi:hypothetical protein
MGSKLSASDQQKLEALTEGKRKWDRIHMLVEKSVSEERAREALMRQCHRTASGVARFFANNALGPLAQTANDLAFTIKRSGRFETKLGALREAVGRGYAAIDQGLGKLRRQANVVKANRP